MLDSAVHSIKIIQMKNRKNSGTSIIVGIIFIASSYAFYSFFGSEIVKKASLSEEWPTTTGVITSSEIRESKNDEGTNMYAADVTYEYQVDEAQYTGNRISLNSANSTTSSINSVLKDIKKYPEGERVTVYYDPEYPGESVLQPGADWVVYLVKFLPLFMGVLGLFIVLSSLKRMFGVALAFFAATRK